MKYPSEAVVADMQNRFAYHAPTGNKVNIHAELRNRFGAIALFTLASTPPSREQSLAITKIEEAMLWANAAIARNPEPVETTDQKVD